MSASPLDQHHNLVPNPTAGIEAAEALREEQRALRAEELALLRRKMVGMTVYSTGVANVVLQLSWPEVGYGVVESKVSSGQVTRRPLKRFRTTVGYLGVALLGSHAQRLAFREAINTQHRQVRSTADSPVKYNAFNRDLQLWVASCLHYGIVDVITRLHGPLSREDEVILLRAGARFGTTLQVPADMWHRTPEEFWAYWEEGLERAAIDDKVRDYLLGLLRLTFLSSPVAWLFGPFHAWLNTGFLPPLFREQLGLSWSERDQRRHDRILKLVGLASRPLPPVVRAFPINAMQLNLELRRRLGRPMV